VKKIIFVAMIFFSMMLILIVYLSYKRQYSIIINNYLNMEAEVIEEAKLMANLWFTKRSEDGDVSIDQIEQEILTEIIEPIHLLQNGDAWIYNKDYVIFDKSSDFPEYYRGKSMRQIFEMQSRNGASHYEDMTLGVENGTEGRGWYIWLPEKGKEWVAWTSFRFHQQTWTLGLSTPEEEILQNADIYSFLIKQIIYFSILIILLFIIACLFLIFHKRQENLIRELQNGRTRLQEMNAKKDKFFSIIAHDLRNPISSIIGLSVLLTEKTKNRAPEDVVMAVELLQQASGRVMDLLSNLLEWSTNELGKNVYQPVEFDINNAVRDTIELLRLQSVKKDIRFNFDNSIPVIVNTDLHMVRTILRNIISNAVKFSFPASIISISTEINSDNVLLTVRDSGIGMNEETVNNLFRIDVHHSTPGTESEKGTGLGLILCRELTEKLGGDLKVESKLNEGTSFYLSIPSGR